MVMRSIFALVLALLLALAPAARADEPAPDLLRLLHRIDTVQDLHARGLLTAEVAAAEERAALASAAEVAGRTLSLDDLRALEGPATTTATKKKAEGFNAFVIVMWVIAALLVVLAAGWLTVLYLVPLVLRVPRVVLEGLVWAACLAATVGGAFLASPTTGLMLAFTGCLGLPGALAFTDRLHLREREFDRAVIYNGLMCFVWAAVAAAYHSQLIALLSVLAYVSALGFSVACTPLCYAIGFRDRETIPRAMSAGLILVVTFTALAVTGARVPVLQPQVPVFQPAALFVGSFVWFVGLLIVSSRYYARERGLYLGLQALTIASGIAALGFGSIYQLGYLQKIGGTFFALYLLEKYFEVPWKRAGWAWCMLGLGLVLWGGAAFATRHPELFFGF